jgi:hypothetical protein
MINNFNSEKMAKEAHKEVMRNLPKINPESTFAKLGPIERRINGVFSYFILMLISIWNPYIADAALYRVFKRQFIEQEENKNNVDPN